MLVPEIHWSLGSTYPILSALQLLPFIAALLTFRNYRFVVAIGVLLAGIEVLMTVDLFILFDRDLQAMQFFEKISLIPPLTYHVAADGITVMFMLLTSILTLMLIIYSRIRQLNPANRFIPIVFLVEASLQGIFATQDLLWFTLLSAFELTLIGYLLMRWATSPAEDLARLRYIQFMSTGLFLLLAGTLLLGWNYAEANNGIWSFNLHDLTSSPVPVALQSIIFFLLFYGLAIRVPLFPLHGWLPMMSEHGTIAVTGVFLLGLKTGIYGLIRFVFPLLSDAVIRWHEYVVAFSVVGIFYAAFLALMQVNLRRLLAFAVVSHTSILIIGLFSLSEAGFQGSILLSVNFGLAISGMMIMTGFVYHRTRTLLFTHLGGLFDKIPFIGIAFLVGGLSIIGMPGTPGFDAVHLVTEAAIVRFGALITIAAAVGNVIAAGFLLWAFQQAFLSPVIVNVKKEIIRATPLELLIAGSFIAILVTTGFFSEPWLDLIESSLRPLDELYNSGTLAPEATHIDVGKE